MFTTKTEAAIQKLALELRSNLKELTGVTVSGWCCWCCCCLLIILFVCLLFVSFVFVVVVLWGRGPRWGGGWGGGVFYHKLQTHHPKRQLELKNIRRQE